MRPRHLLKIMRVLLVLLSLSLLAANCVYATENDVVEPRASYYLTSYNTYIYPDAWGKIQVWFTVTGVEYMDEIGTLSIQLFESTDNENWTRVKTYTHDSTTGMLGYNKIYYSGCVEYNGTIGRYYKAYVCIWAGKDGAGDTRYMWTQPKKASLLGG